MTRFYLRHGLFGLEDLISIETRKVLGILAALALSIRHRRSTSGVTDRISLVPVSASVTCSSRRMSSSA
jgi:hypothetical protein